MDCCLPACCSRWGAVLAEHAVTPDQPQERSAAAQRERSEQGPEQRKYFSAHGPRSAHAATRRTQRAAGALIHNGESADAEATGPTACLLWALSLCLCCSGIATSARRLPNAIPTRPLTSSTAPMDQKKPACRIPSGRCCRRSVLIFCRGLGSAGFYTEPGHDLPVGSRCASSACPASA